MERKPRWLPQGERSMTTFSMTLDYNIDGKVHITMFEYIAKIIEEFPMELDGEPTSTAANHFFEVDDNGIKLKPKQKDMFHEFVA